MLQQLIVGAVVLTAVSFVARRMWLAIAVARAPKGAGCASGCGCAPATAPQRNEPVRH